MKSINLPFALTAGLSCLSMTGLAAEKVNISLSESNSTLEPAPLLTTGINQIVSQDSGSELVEVKSVSLPNGKTLTRYRQYYNGLPVYGQSVAARAESGAFRRITGNILRGLAADIPAAEIRNRKLDKDAALEAAVADELGVSVSTAAAVVREKMATLENVENRLMILLDGQSRARLVYAISWVDHSADQPSRPFRILDANSGEILKSWEGLTHADANGPGGNEKTGQYEYGSDFGYLDVTLSGGNCVMENRNVRTVNLNHATSGGDTHGFTCPRNTVKAINGAYSPLNDAHFFGGVVFDMYSDWYSTSPLLQQLVLRVHYDTNYENAFWDGVQMTFGDGLNSFYPLVSLGRNPVISMTPPVAFSPRPRIRDMIRRPLPPPSILSV